MADVELALHKAIFTRLETLTTAAAYDAVPQDTPKPYVTLDTMISENDDRLGNSRANNAFVFLHVWSESRGQEEVKRILDEMSGVFHEVKLPLDNGTLISVRVQQKSTQRDADNVTFHGSMTLRVIVKH